jgi:hypothetical protein
MKNPRKVLKEIEENLKEKNILFEKVNNFVLCIYIH